MDKQTITKLLVKMTTKAIELKRKLIHKLFSREVSLRVHDQQREETERILIEVVTPIIEDQIEDMVRRLRAMEGKSKTKDFSDDAEALVSQIFNPLEWKSKLVDKVLPVLAVEMAKAGITQWAQFGVDVRKIAANEKN